MTTAREVKKMLQQLGWTFVEGKRHTKAISPDGTQLIPIPRHGSKDIATGTLGDILKKAGIKQ